jgi:co-chaperonin GroES (HSP10)
MEIPEIGVFKNLIVVGDRILVKPNPHQDQLSSGLYLPATIKTKEEVASGQVIKVGPGYALPGETNFDNHLHQKEDVKYLPLQTKVGDTAIFLKKSTWEIVYKKEKYLIVPQNSVLLIVRDELSDLNIH